MDISVILPFHNSEHILSASIESIINQGFENWELILIDRNSDDDSGRIAREFESDDDRILYRKENEKGIVAALNKGLQASSGKYISILEPGDIALPQKLEKQFSYLEENKDYDVVASCAEYVNDEGLQFGNFEYIKWTNGIKAHEEITGSSFIDCPLIHSTIMYRKETIINELYRLGDFPEDYEILLRLLNKNVQMHKLSDHLLEWIDSPERLERKNDLVAGERAY